MMLRLLPETPEEPFALWEILNGDDEPLVGLILDSKFQSLVVPLCCIITNNRRVVKFLQAEYLMRVEVPHTCSCPEWDQPFVWVSPMTSDLEGLILEYFETGEHI